MNERAEMLMIIVFAALNLFSAILNFMSIALFYRSSGKCEDDSVEVEVEAEDVDQ